MTILYSSDKEVDMNSLMTALMEVEQRLKQRDSDSHESALRSP